MNINSERLQELQEISEKIDKEQRAIITPLLQEVCFMESRLAELRTMPHIRTHPVDKARQEITAAGKQYKETMQAYLNAIKVIMSALYRAGGGGAADELLKKLQEFEL